VVIAPTTMQARERAATGGVSGRSISARMAVQSR
jgi:hypothetical protein